MGGPTITPLTTTWRYRPFDSLPMQQALLPSTRSLRLESMTLSRVSVRCVRSGLTKSQLNCWLRPCRLTATWPPFNRLVRGNRSVNTIAQWPKWPRYFRSYVRLKPSCFRNSSGPTSSGWRRSPTAMGYAPPTFPSMLRLPVEPWPSRPSVHPSERIIHDPG